MPLAALPAGKVASDLFFETSLVLSGFKTGNAHLLPVKETNPAFHDPFATAFTAQCALYPCPLRQWFANITNQKKLFQRNGEHLFRLESAEFIEAFLLFREQLSGRSLLLEAGPFVVGFPGKGGIEDQPGRTATPAAIEAEGRFPIIMKYEIALAECAANEGLNGIDATHVRFGKHNNIFILRPSQMFQRPVGSSEPDGKTGAEVSMKADGVFLLFLRYHDDVLLCIGQSDCCMLHNAGWTTGSIPVASSPRIQALP